ncbi:MAG: NACHT domain-containing protein [Bacteroidetes bacterium]|nr:NACHT domain-containing protein [Bacteroidota bacterium]
MTTTLTIGAQLLSVFKDGITKYGIRIKDDFIQIFLNGISDYIDNYYDRYYKTKTFIYRDEKVNFYDIYYPVTIKNTKNEAVNIIDIIALFEKIRFLTIIGTAGSGKSMLMKYIFLETVKTHSKIPIVVELRNLNDFDGTITDYIYKILTKNKLAANEKIIEQLLSEGKYLFLFDGYDEIYSTSKDKITNELEEFIDNFNMNCFILTSRPGANAESLQRFDNFYVQPLDTKQINEFVHLQFKNHDNLESVGKIISVINKEKDNEYTEYLSNPLLLSMFIFTFNSYPELPRSKSKFYWNVFDTLCTKHDAFTKKGFWLHERKSKLLNEDFEKILQWFSYISIFSGKYNFDQAFLKSNLILIKDKLKLICSIDDLVYDLTVSISILIQDGTEFTFPHKSLQEYFTALLISNLNRNQKEEIYTKKFEKLNSNTNGGNANLYKLCSELDRDIFLKDFIIKNGKIFLSEIDYKNDRSIVVSYSKLLDLSLTFYRKQEDVSNFSLAMITYKGIYIASFFNYFQLNPIDIFDDIPKIEKHIHLMKETFSKYNEKSEKFELKTLTIRFCEDCNDEVFEFAIKSGILTSIKDTLRTIESNINELESQIISDSESTEELLSI